MAQLPRAIFLTSESPFPSTSSGKQRDAQLIRLLNERTRIEVFCFAHDSELPSDEVSETGTPVRRIRRSAAPLWKKWFSKIRPTVTSDLDPAMIQILKEHAAPGRLLWISKLEMASYVPVGKRLGYRVILDKHHVEAARMMEIASSSPIHWHESLLAAYTAWHEEKYCMASDAVVTTSELNAARLLKLAPDASVHIIPSSVDVDQYARARNTEGRKLFFPATLSYSSNIDDLRWFISEILPRLRAAMGVLLPEIVVAGENPRAQTISELSNAGIQVVSNPNSIIPFLEEASVVFIPNRSGTARVKILQAMAAGRSVVTTGRGASGLVLKPTYDVFIADQPDSFTSAIIRLLRNDELRTSVGARAVKTVEQNYDWRCARSLLDQLLESLDRNLSSPADDSERSSLQSRA